MVSGIGQLWTMSTTILKDKVSHDYLILKDTESTAVCLCWRGGLCLQSTGVRKAGTRVPQAELLAWVIRAMTCLVKGFHGGAFWEVLGYRGFYLGMKRTLLQRFLRWDRGQTAPESGGSEALPAAKPCLSLPSRPSPWTRSLPTPLSLCAEGQECAWQHQ